MGVGFGDDKYPCLPGYKLIPGEKNRCAGPPVDCPGQQGAYRIFKEGSKSDTVCTTAKGLPDGPNGCPDSYFQTSVAQRPYNTVCVSRSANVPRRLTPAQKRTEIARNEEETTNQISPNKVWKTSAVGTGNRILRISTNDVSNSILNGLFRSGPAYAQNLWKAGFKLTVINDGREFWAGALTPSGYGKVTGPHDAEPTLEEFERGNTDAKGVTAESARKKSNIEYLPTHAPIDRSGYEAAFAKLGLHIGQPQAAVKSILQRDGFKMPWQCAGKWGEDGGTWISYCFAYRGKDEAVLGFSVYRRVRYVNPDTQVSTVGTQNTDKLFFIKYTDGVTGQWGTVDK